MKETTKNMKKPKVALVLGAGGAKGLAHIGVLRALEKHKIKFDLLVGCSMGAIVGACYALGVPLDELEKRAKQLSRSEVLDVKLPNKYGFVKGDKAERVIKKLLKTEVPPTFKDCKVPFACACTDLYKGEPVWLTSGEILPAVRASFSIGGVFQPVEINDKHLVDGGVLARVPVDLARKMGADVVIAVDCVGKNYPLKENELSSYFDTVTRVFNLLDYGASIEEMKRADLLLQMYQPEVSAIKIKNIDKSIAYGEKIIEDNLAKIKAVIKAAKTKEIAK